MVPEVSVGVVEYGRRGALPYSPTPLLPLTPKLPYPQT